MEGQHCFAATGCEGCSITGGYVYRGAAIPLLQGHYLYADFCRGLVRSLRIAGEVYVLTAQGGVFKIAGRQ